MMKVSVILTTYNCEETVGQTLESIDKQDYENIEIIIKDACSTDGTLAIIKSYEEKGTRKIIFSSKKDQGIYDAMNQGYEISTGEIIVFFNDVFAHTQVVSKMVHLISSKEQCQGAHADLVYRKQDEIVRVWKMGEGNIKRGWMPAHPTLFLKREIYEKYGLYNTKYKCAADYEFMIRILKDEKIQLAHLPEIIVKMFYGGTSTNGIRGYWLSFKEGNAALKENNISNPLLISVRRIIKTMKQFS